MDAGGQPAAGLNRGRNCGKHVTAMRPSHKKRALRAEVRRALASRVAAAAAMMLAASLTLFADPSTALRADPGPRSRLEPVIERAAEAYLRALVNGDGAALTRLAPSRLESKYGPCPFAAMPILHSPRVDAHRAGILFTGKLTDPEVPGEGGFTLTKLDGARGNPWRVRQVLFFTKLPLGARMPKRSVTRKDEAQEPLVAAATRRYVSAWVKGDYRTMEALAYDWLPGAHRIGSMKIRSIELRARPATDGETRVNFTAKVTMYKLLPKTIEGTLFAMREGTEWKIRGTELTL